MSSTLTTQNTGTLADFVALRSNSLLCGEEQAIAFTTDFYNMALQLVMDNDFSKEAKLAFPVLSGASCMEQITGWWHFINIWYETLSLGEQERFAGSSVIWD